MQDIKQQFNKAYKNKVVYRSLNKGFFDEHFSKLKGEALDFGCGRGEASVFLAERGLKVDAVDFSLEASKQQIQHKGVKYIFGDENAIPDKKYNFILLKLVLAFVKDGEKMIKILRSHLKKDGVLLIVTPIKRVGYNRHEDFISVEDKDVKSLKKLYTKKAGRLEVRYYVCGRK